MCRFIFITGGVVSSLGKGIVSATLGALLQARGYSVCLRKFDPYLNYDPGTMNPFQHGEVFVTEDGAETDLDLGHYERFTGIECTKNDSITTGRIYDEILKKERRGDFNGETVQVIPHVTNSIKQHFSYEADKYDFIICEIGGTVGDIEGLPFFEAARQFANDVPANHAIFVHLTLLPYIEKAGELKTKPTQHSVKELRSIGIQPNVIICRTQHPISKADRNKISLFCNVRYEAIIEAMDQNNIYEVPYAYHQEKLDTIILQELNIEEKERPQINFWKEIVDRNKAFEAQITVGIVGKYTNLRDAYKSLFEALYHGGLHNKVAVNIVEIDAESIEESVLKEKFIGIDGIIVPGGFGSRGTEGKMMVANYAYENNIPFLGICYGMQLAVISRLRYSKVLKTASSEEFSQKDHNAQIVVGRMKQWIKENKIIDRSKNNNRGGTMRLGSYMTNLENGSQIAQIYQKDHIFERHRHRYEIDIDYKKEIEKSGLKITGRSPDGHLPEVIEAPSCDWYIGVQYHPELKSKPFDAHPLFVSFVNASLKHSRLV